MVSIITTELIAEHHTLVYDADEVNRVFRLIGQFDQMRMPVMTTHRSAEWFVRACWWLKAQRLAEWREIGTMFTVKEWHLTPEGYAKWLRDCVTL